MALQLYFHIAMKTARLSPKSAMRWRKIHIFLGYLLIAVFISHSDFSLPDTEFEWALWAGFVLVTLTGVFGTYLAWSLRTKRQIDERHQLRSHSVSARRTGAGNRDAVATSTWSPAAIAVPVPPYRRMDFRPLYAASFAASSRGRRNFIAHLFGSQRPLKRVIGEIDNCQRFVDRQRAGEIAAIKGLVCREDGLDFAHVYLGLAGLAVRPCAGHLWR